MLTIVSTWATCQATVMSGCRERLVALARHGAWNSFSNWSRTRRRAWYGQARHRRPAASWPTSTALCAGQPSPRAWFLRRGVADRRQGTVASTKVVCDELGDERASNVRAATA